MILGFPLFELELGQKGLSDMLINFTYIKYAHSIMEMNAGGPNIGETMEGWRQK